MNALEDQIKAALIDALGGMEAIRRDVRLTPELRDKVEEALRKVIKHEPNLVARVVSTPEDILRGKITYLVQPMPSLEIKTTISKQRLEELLSGLHPEDH